MRPVFILCEGLHDIALLGPLLEGIGAQQYRRELKDYPPSLSAFLKGRFGLRAGSVDSARFRSEDPFLMDEPPVLAAAYELDATLFLLFGGGGDSQHIAIKSFLETLIDLGSEETPADTRIPPFGVIFVRDADQSGVGPRLAELRTQYGSVLERKYASLQTLTINEAVWTGDYSLGVCVFSKEGHDYGALEHLLEPTLQAHYAGQWQDADDYVRRHTGANSALDKA